jgi:hypothetical protein
VALPPSGTGAIGEIKVFRGDGKGGFTFNPVLCLSVPICGTVFAMITGDFNHPGELDLAVLTEDAFAPQGRKADNRSLQCCGRGMAVWEDQPTFP